LTLVERRTEHGRGAETQRRTIRVVTTEAPLWTIALNAISAFLLSSQRLCEPALSGVEGSARERLSHDSRSEPRGPFPGVCLGARSTTRRVLHRGEQVCERQRFYHRQWVPIGNLEAPFIYYWWNDPGSPPSNLPTIGVAPFKHYCCLIPILCEAAISHHHFNPRGVSHGSQFVQLLSSKDSNPYFGNSVSCSRKTKHTVSTIAGFRHCPICSLRNEFCFHGGNQFPYAGE